MDISTCALLIALTLPMQQADVNLHGPLGSYATELPRNLGVEAGVVIPFTPDLAFYGGAEWIPGADTDIRTVPIRFIAPSSLHIQDSIRLKVGIVYNF